MTLATGSLFSGVGGLEMEARAVLEVLRAFPGSQVLEVPKAIRDEVLRLARAVDGG